MIELWEGKKKYTKEQEERVLDKAAIRNLVGNSCMRLSNKTRDALEEAINGDAIGPQVSRDGTYISARINTWLWKSIGIKYEGKKGEADLIKVEADHQVQDLIEYPIYVEISNKMDWKKGTFGDGASCFFGCHSVHRHYFNSLPNFYTLKMYTKDKKPFGRCLVLTDIPKKGCVLVFNSYPNHRTGMYLNLYAEILKDWIMPKAIITEHDVSNRVGGSWLYLNSGTGTFLHDNLIEEGTSVELNLLKNSPRINEIEGYEGRCLNCDKYIFNWETFTKIEKQVCICNECTDTYNRLDVTCPECNTKISSILCSIQHDFKNFSYELLVKDSYKRVCVDCKNVAMIANAEREEEHDEDEEEYEDDN
jgi:hypothetical protein